VLDHVAHEDQVEALIGLELVERSVEDLQPSLPGLLAGLE
jgi:hypothetical protein